MSTRHAVFHTALLLLAVSASLSAEGIVIDHKPVGCVVTGKYPRFDACLSPASQVVRARLYFKPQDAPIWYYVVMQRESPCYTGTLPRPTKKLAGKRLLYYIDAADRRFVESRTPDMSVDIAGDAQGCRKDVPVAPTVPNATVAVFPQMPAGFAAGAGIGAGTVAAIGATSVAVVGGGVAVASRGGGPPSETTTTSIRTTAVTTTTTTTTTIPSQNRPPNADFRVSPDPPEGNSPLEVTFNMCRSTDPDGDELKFRFDFGDGSTVRGNCRSTHVYLDPPGPPSALATLCVTDGVLGHDRCQSYSVRPRSRDRCANERQPPTVSEIRTNPFPVEGPPGIPLFVTASDNVGIALVEFFAEPEEGSPVLIGSDAIGDDGIYSTTWEAECGDYVLTARARDVCGNTATSPPLPVNIDCGEKAGASAASSSASVALTSDLRLAGGQGQVAVNGRGSLPAGSGPLRASVSVEAGENVVEAIVLKGKGEVGTWRFELSRLEPGSLRVHAGDVAQIAEHEVIFRVSGRPGERLAFRFRARPR